MKQELAALCRFLSEGTGDDHGLRATWRAMLNAGGLGDSLRPSADVHLSLPPLDGVTLHLRAVVFEDDSWSLHLNAEPDWWCCSQDHDQKRTLVEIVAEDDVGGTYVSLNGGALERLNDAGDDVLLRFRPRMAPLRRASDSSFVPARNKLWWTLHFLKPVPRDSLPAVCASRQAEDVRG